MAAKADENEYFVREIERNDGCALKVKQCFLGDVGCVVWDAAIVLAKYLETKQFYDPSSGVNVWSGRTVLELGAGTGVVVLCLNIKIFKRHSLHYYYVLSIVPLVESLKLLCGPETCIVCCYEQRTEGVNPEVERQFFELLQQNFCCEEIPSEKQDPEFSSPDIHILHIRRKA
uniref:Valosin containing protein lysine (K) methyltransferase n=1 Tax=Oreochromis niloticus TaxID=8128 RepID=A0A669DVA7_ORENI